MAELQTKHGTGIALGFVGGLLLSIDVPLIRLALSDPWMVMVVRGGTMAIALYLVWQLAGDRTGTPAAPLADRDWMTVAILFGVINILFTLAVFATSTANLVFILAFNPMIAAILGWWMIGERPKLVTWIAIAGTISGVALIVGEGLDRGTGWGDLASLGCAVLLGYTLVRARRSGKDMSLAPGFGGLFSAIFAIPLAIVYSSWPGEMLWLLADGLLLVSIASFCLLLAPLFIPAPQAAMFFLLETVLAPLWVWMIFAEAPGDRTLAGGIVVLAAIAGHSFWQIRRPKAVNGGELAAKPTA